MKRLSIFTARHEGLLRSFAENAAGRELIYINRFYKKCGGCAFDAAIVQHENFCEALMILLTEIATAENAVYRCSPRLREMAHDLKNTPVFGRELRNLRAFLQENSQLNLEGYVTFRMHEFRDKLDIMIYSLVKKIKFGARDW